MSMIGNYFAVTEQQVRSFQSKPDEIAELLEGEDVEDSEFYLYIGKSWHGIRFLLTGSVWEGESPLRWVIMPEREMRSSKSIVSSASC
jgi:hypothetical protein